MENERGTKFCQKLWHDLGLYVENQRDKGLSDRQIQQRLAELQQCGISAEGWKKRIQHRDTCTHLGVEPTQLTQSETRKFQKLTNHDKKRVAQCLHDLSKNKDKPPRQLFREAIRRVEPLILKRKAAAPQNLSPINKSTPETTSDLSAGRANSSSGEKPPRKHRETVTIEWQEPPPIPQGLIETSIGLYDPSRSYPDECRSHNDDCPALAMWRAHMVEVMNR